MNEKKAEDNHRPWGFYEILADEFDHKVKRITVYPDKRLSLQKHKKRAEHWFVVKGKGTATLGNKLIELKSGESIDIQKETAHRIQNIGSENLIFIEIQTGNYFEEDDIERIEDDFGRS